jgi:trk system potassium uptake protein TrkA
MPILLIAVTQSDQTNLVACKLAHSVFNVPTRIARLRASRFPDSEDAAVADNFAVDYALCPEEGGHRLHRRLIEFPEALQVLSFAGGRVSLVAVRAYDGGSAGRQPIKEMRNHLPPSIDGRIAAIYRRDGAIVRRPATPSSKTATKSSCWLPTSISGP